VSEGVVLFGQQVAVAIQRRLDRGVTEAAHDAVLAHPLRNAEGDMSVSEVVEAQL